MTGKNYFLFGKQWQAQLTFFLGLLLILVFSIVPAIGRTLGAVAANARFSRLGATVPTDPR